MYVCMYVYIYIYIYIERERERERERNCNPTHAVSYRLAIVQFQLTRSSGTILCLLIIIGIVYLHPITHYSV